MTIITSEAEKAVVRRNAKERQGLDQLVFDGRQMPALEEENVKCATIA
jgi:hypothetical protein